LVRAWGHLWPPQALVTAIDLFAGTGAAAERKRRDLFPEGYIRGQTPWLLFGMNAGLIALNQAHDVCEVFDEKNTHLPDHHVTQIVEDPRGAIWITLCGGIVELEP